MLAEVGVALTAAEAAELILKQLEDVKKELNPFKPEVKSFRINYLEKNSEIRYLLFIPDGLRRRIKRKVEIPAVTGFRFDELWDLDKLALVNPFWSYEDNKWILNVGNLPSSEKYLLTIKGRISDQFLNQLVSVKAAENPCREGMTDKYWIHSALKDVDAFRKIWTALDIEQVNAEVRIGVERIFTSAIPHAVKERLEVQKKLLDAISSGDRDGEQRLKMKYRSLRGSHLVSPSELYDLFISLASGSFFADFLRVTQEFTMAGIEPIRDYASIVPEKVKVGVQTDLTYDNKAVKGELCFEREKYNAAVSDKVKELLKIGKKKN